MSRLAWSVTIALLVLGATAPASAASASGSVIAPVAHPAAVRVAYNAGINTNLIGVVIPLPAGADDKPYTLQRTSGLGNLDAYFYTKVDGAIGDLCSPIVDAEDDGINTPTETGIICAGPQVVGFAVIVLRTGANAGFSLTW